MSKKTKNRQREKRLQQKRARKAANRNKYEAWKNAGQNTKSKRAKSAIKKTRLVNTVDHKDGYCGNLACKKCNHKTKQYISNG